MRFISMFFSFVLGSAIFSLASATTEEPTDTLVETWYFSVNISDNWAYENADYAPPNIFGWTQNNAIQMFPNTFENTSIVYGMIAQDEYFQLKNAGLNHYVNYKMNNPNLKYLNESKLILKEDNVLNINGSKSVKLTYENQENQFKIVVYLIQHDKENYVGYFYSKQNHFDKFFPEFEKMIQTIKFKKDFSPVS